MRPLRSSWIAARKPICFSGSFIIQGESWRNGAVIEGEIRAFHVVGRRRFEASLRGCPLMARWEI